MSRIKCASPCRRRSDSRPRGATGRARRQARAAPTTMRRTLAGRRYARLAVPRKSHDFPCRRWTETTCTISGKDIYLPFGLSSGLDMGHSFIEKYPAPHREYNRPPVFFPVFNRRCPRPAAGRSWLIPAPASSSIRSATPISRCAARRCWRSTVSRSRCAPASSWRCSAPRAAARGTLLYLLGGFLPIESGRIEVGGKVR